MNIQNCTECGKLFAYVRRNICPDCIEKEEQMYHVVREFLKNNPGLTIHEISEKTEVPEEKINLFLREGRIAATYLNEKMGLHCESCGAPIASGKLCGACKLVLTKEVENISYKSRHSESTGTSTKNHKNKMFTVDHFKK